MYTAKSRAYIGKRPAVRALRITNETETAAAARRGFVLYNIIYT